MKTKLLFFLILVSTNRLFAQQINCRNDSGNMIIPESHSSIGTYKRTKYLDKQTGNLKLELFLKKYNTGETIYDSYYRWNNKIIFMDRLSYTKEVIKPTRSFYIWNDCIYEKVGKEFVLCDDSVKLIGSRIRIITKD